MSLENKYQSTIVQDMIIKDILSKSAKPSFLVVYNFLVARRNFNTKEIKASYNFIHQGTGISIGTIKQALIFLQENHYIYKLHIRGKPNIYFAMLDEFLLAPDLEHKMKLEFIYRQTVENNKCDLEEFLNYYRFYVVPLLTSVA